MDYILVDDGDVRGNLLPLTYTRPVCHLRIGIDTIAEKWQRMLPGQYTVQTAHYLRNKYGDPCNTPEAIRIASNIIPDKAIVDAIVSLPPDSSLHAGGAKVAWRGNGNSVIEYAYPIKSVNQLYDIFGMNDDVLRADFDAKAQNRRRAPSSTVTIIGNPDNLYIHPMAGDVEGCVINVATGPVYVGPHATVMEGACLRGPVAVCEQSVVKMGARIYGATTIGPYCKVGGEIENTVFLSYSNKAHDGFLGNAVIGEWCNIGAGCVASNLKNDYTPIRLWNYPTHRFLRTSLQFCGLIMGDHSKTGVNTMLNTATVLGVGVNIHGSGFPRPFVASFSEGSTAGYNDVVMAKFFDTARTVMARRGVELSEADINILTYIREYSEQYR